MRAFDTSGRPALCSAKRHATTDGGEGSHARGPSEGMDARGRSELMSEVDEIRMNVAIASRILGMVGLLIGTTGHVSARIPGTDEMWIRCRGGDEKGNLFTGLHNVRRVDF